MGGNVWRRWVAVVVAAIAAFVACWAVLALWVGLDEGVALGWAIVPFTVLLTIGGVWADRARSQREQSPSVKSLADQSKRVRVNQKQRAGDNSQQLQVGGDFRVERRDG